MKISKDTIIYAFGDDRRDPIHFSADERDMDVISHQDEINNWVKPEQFFDEDLEDHELWNQADLEVLSINFFDGVVEKEDGSFANFHIPYLYRLV